MSNSSNGRAPPTSSEDDNVVNAAVATVILPRLRKLAVEAYDPFSRSMTGKALHVVEEISYCLETTNQRFQVSPYFYQTSSFFGDSLMLISLLCDYSTLSSAS